MKHNRWWIMGLGVLTAGAIVLLGGCRKETTPAEDEPTEGKPAESEPAEAVPPESAFLEPSGPAEEPFWDDSAFDLETSLEAEPDDTLPDDLDGL